MAESFFVCLTADLLREGYSLRCRTHGGSMYPTIANGEKVVVEPVASSQVKRGDIILYQGQRGVIAHRVVGIGSDHGCAMTQPAALSARDVLVLRGDAFDVSDEPVEVSRVLGKVVAVKRNGRNIGLEGCLPKRVSAVRLGAARLRRVIGSRLPRVAYLIRTCRDLFRVALKASA